MTNLRKRYRVGKDSSAAKEAAEMLKAVGHPLRLRIVAKLAERDCHVNGLAQALETGQAAVSQQLRILRMRGLVSSSRENGHSVYRISEPHLLKMLDCIDGWLHRKDKSP